LGCVPIVTRARLDKVRPKVAFADDMTASINWGRFIFQEFASEFPLKVQSPTFKVRNEFKR
jgi:hypothetical protein